MMILSLIVAPSFCLVAGPSVPALAKHARHLLRTAAGSWRHFSVGGSVETDRIVEHDDGGLGVAFGVSFQRQGTTPSLYYCYASTAGNLKNQCL
jgi:hypothetical protein